MVAKKIDEKESLELKEIYNHYLDKRKENMNSTKFKVEVIFDDVRSKILFHLIKKPNLTIF